MRKSIFKAIFIIAINIFFILILFFLCEYFIWNKYSNDYTKTSVLLDRKNIEFKYSLRNPKVSLTNIENYFTGNGNFYWGRKPDGLQYKNSVPITVFGCSFAYGQNLNYNQTFSYKLSKQLKRPVYNRAMPASGLQHMYLQSTLDSTYNNIPPADLVLYVMIQDHYRRLLINSFNIAENYFYLHYSDKKNKLVKDNYNNIFGNFYRSSYIQKYLNHYFSDRFIYNDKNADKLTNLVLSYFLETRKNLEKNWNKKFKFVIIFYKDITYEDLLSKKLKENGFIVIQTKELIKEDLNSSDFKLEDNHPNEKAWNLLVPLIVRELNL